MKSQGRVLVLGKKQKKGEFEGRQYAFTDIQVLGGLHKEDGYKVEQLRAGYEDYSDIIGLPALFDCDAETQYGKTTLSNFKRINGIIIDNEKGVKNG